jgi:hypothetical protein
MVTPWTAFWDRNYFAALAPSLHDWMRAPGLRAAVTAVGIVTAIAGVREFGAAFAARARARLGASDSPPAP